jgi:predicted aspartyl protease
MAGKPIPARLAARLFFVPVLVNGQGPFQFVLDTGASETVITPGVARKIGLKTTPQSTGQDIARVATFALGSAVAKDFRVRVFDPVAARPLRLDFGLDYHGLAGATFLENFVVRVDYLHTNVCLLARDAHPANTNDVTITRIENLIRVPVMVNNRGPFNFLLDTGAAETLVFPGTASRAGLVAPGGAQPAGRIPVPSFRIGACEAKNVLAIVDTQADPRVSQTYDGILGYSFLSRFCVTIDYPHSRLHLDAAP